MAYIGRSVDIGMFEKQVLTADSSTTTFTLTFAVGSANSLLVVYGGVIQEPGVAYSVSGGGQSIVFSEAPATNHSLYVIYLGKQLTTPRAAGQETSKQTFTGDGAITQFTLTDAPVVPAGIMVFVDGILQREGAGNNYVSGGSTINFSSPPDNGAEIDVYTLVKEKISIDTVVDGSITRAKMAATFPFWDSSGQFAIGLTSSNNNKLTVYGQHVSGRSHVAIRTSDATTGSPAIIGFYNSADSRVSSFGHNMGQSLSLTTQEAVPIIFNTTDTERMRISETGNVVIKGSSANSARGAEFDFIGGRARFNNYLTIGRGPNNNDGLFFNVVPSNDGTVYTPSYIGSGGAGSTFIGMPSGGNGGLQVKVYRHGTSSATYNEAAMTTVVDINDSGILGLRFGAIQDAKSDPNTLDDYEEGTWTVAATNVTVNSGTMTYVGVYTKIGNLVHFTISARNTGGTFTAVADNAYFTLPFSTTTDNSNNIYAGCTILNVATTTSGGVGQIGPSGNVRMATTFTNVTWLSITGTYRTTT